MATLGEMRGQTDLFSAVQPAHREQVARAMEPRAYRAGEEIVREGDAGDAMYLVLSGRVAVVVRSQDLGASFELARLGPGDHFGEMALLTAEPRTASVVAIEETRAVALPDRTPRADHHAHQRRDVGRRPVAQDEVGVVAQRLVRRLCPACRKPGTYPPAVLENLAAVGALRPGDEASLFDAVGCEQCGGSGFRDRVGVFEMLLFDERVRRAVAEDRPLASFRPALEGTGFVSLGRYAAYLLKAGLTVPGEVLRAVRVEQQIPG